MAKFPVAAGRIFVKLTVTKLSLSGADCIW